MGLFHLSLQPPTSTLPYQIFHLHLLCRWQMLPPRRPFPEYKEIEAHNAFEILNKF